MISTAFSSIPSFCFKCTRWNSFSFHSVLKAGGFLAVDDERWLQITSEFKLASRFANAMKEFYQSEFLAFEK